MELIEKASVTYIETERELRQKAHRGTLSDVHVHQSVYLSLCMSVSLSLCPCLSVYVPACTSVCVCPSVSLSDYLLSDYLPAFASV